MTFGWLGRFGVIFAIVAPIAAIVLCGLFVHGAWTPNAPCICAINDILDPPSSDPMETRIVPPVYLLPAFAVLRAVTIESGIISAKTLGAIVLVAIFIAPFALTFFNWSKAPAPARYSLLMLWPILISLGWIGAQRPTDIPAIISVMLIAAYFALFLAIFPLLTRQRQ